MSIRSVPDDLRGSNLLGPAKAALSALLLRVFIVIGASAVIFFGTQILPGDYVTEMLGQEYSEDIARNIREKLGLERPLHERYVLWLVNFLRGDFGISFVSRTEVWSVFRPRLVNTLALAGFTLTIWFPVALLAGLGAFLAGERVRRGFLAVTQTLICTPEFLLGYILIYAFAVELHLLPAVSRFSWNEPSAVIFRKFLLPSACLGIGMVAYVGRMVLSLLLMEEAKDYFEFARLRGFGVGQIVARHCLPAIAPSVVNLFFIYCAHLLTGVLVIEVVFGFSGLGDLIVSSVIWRDMPVVQFCAVFITTVYVALYSLSDLFAARYGARLEL